MSRSARFLTALSVLSMATFGFASEAMAQVNLPFIEDWEGTNGETYTALTASLSGAPEWSYDNTGTGGRLRMAAGPAFYPGGAAAATLDRNPSGTNIINYLTLTLDMTNYSVPQDNIVLDFTHSQHGDESNPNDRVWVRGSDSDTFVEVYNLTQGGPSSGQFQTVIDVDISAALVAANQQYTSTFQVRFGQEDNFPATTNLGSDGRTFDDIILRRVLNNDMTMQAIPTPADQSCGESMHDVEVQVLNAGAVTQSMIPVQVDVTGDINMTFMGTVPGPVAKNQTASLVLGQINTYPGVNINLNAQVMLPTDEDTANDMLTEARFIKPTEIIVTPPAPVCPGSGATIAVTPEPLAAFELWDMDVGGNLLATGDTMVSPPIDQMTTFWVERINATLIGGEVDNSFGMGSPYGTFDDGLVFDVNSPIIIQSVYVYPAGTGTVIVELVDSGNNVIGSSVPYQVQAADVNNKTEIPVQLPVAVGANYRLTANGSTVALYRNYEGASYPYTISTWVDITGNVPGIPGAYYFFYDWRVSENVPVCSSERTPVTADVDPNQCSADLVVDVTGPDMADPGDMVEYVITVTNNGPTTAFGTQLALPPPMGLTFVGNTGDCTTGFPCDLGDLAADQVATITAQYTVDEGFAGTATVEATASSTSAEAAPGDETDAVDTTVQAAGVGGGEPATTATGTGGGGATVTNGAGGAGGATGAGGGGDGEDGGCNCRTAGTGSSSSGGWALLLAGLALAGTRRRRRRHS